MLSDRAVHDETGGAAAASPRLVVMGVAGCGKSIVGAELAEALGVSFIEGDRLHPAENIALMASGTPLTDENRAGWLDAVGDAIAGKAETGAVAACSALKRRYRDRLRAAVPGLVFLHLAIDKDTARQRIAARSGHFMPSSLVDSQFADLEPPGDAEAALTLDGRRPIGELVQQAVAFIRNQANGN